MLNSGEEITLLVIRNVRIIEQNLNQLNLQLKLRLPEIYEGKLLLIRTLGFETATVQQHYGYVHCHAGCSFPAFLFPALP